MLSEHGKQLLVEQIDRDWDALSHLCLADHIPGGDGEEVTPIEIERFTQDVVRTVAIHRVRCDQADVLADITPARVVVLSAVLRFLEEPEA